MHNVLKTILELTAWRFYLKMWHILISLSCLKCVVTTYVLNCGRGIMGLMTFTFAPQFGVFRWQKCNSGNIYAKRFTEVLQVSSVASSTNTNIFLISPTKYWVQAVSKITALEGEGVLLTFFVMTCSIPLLLFLLLSLHSFSTQCLPF